ncbi:hypothetical protein M1L60_19255 [Actinoplanes sp. TRM 88003]|uniref:Lipoprotein n=1 Tax=Paractinoplanes aksuensis TaxID=2939490 RepID=A0ABT1DRM6_9ACTN|nr:hypothetical protein [Actinoplanes aksuensis]MCO8272736.1 hypothetical protein [Actinoplanes aksuensis]
MKRLAGITVLLVLTTTAGCGLVDKATAPAGKTEPVITPREQLLRAVPDEKTPAFAFDIKGGVTPISGVLDAPRETFRVQVKQSEPDAGFSMTMYALTVRDKAWMKILFEPADVPGLPRVPRKWLVVDPARVTDPEVAPSGYDGDTDPGYAGLVLKGAAAVAGTGHGHYTGTTDLTASTEAEIVTDARLKALGPKAKAVPFEADVDGDGRLTSLLVRIPAAGKAKAATYHVRYTGFGTTETPVAPAAAEQQKATPVVYDLLNS